MTRPAATEPEVVDPVRTTREDMAYMTHIHDTHGACLKNDAGPRCGSSPRAGRRANMFSRGV